MLRSEGVFAATEPARIDFDQFGDPRSAEFDDGYYSSSFGISSAHDISGGSGIDESNYVFIDGNQLIPRFQSGKFRCFTIGELGFGTGLNFLLSAYHFLRHAPPNARLHYWSVDKFPLSAEQLTQALSRWGDTLAHSDELIACYPPRVPGHHRRILAGGRITLDMIWADAEKAVTDLASFSRRSIDAWFLDGFAPKRNAAMWSDDLLSAVAQASSDSATVATYTAAGAVRRAIEKAGFAVAKRDGFGRKRECVTATLVSRPQQIVEMTPWDLPQHPSPSPREAVVVGAGLAGAHVAAALARRGVSVQILDAGPIAGRASGNLQGTLFTRLSAQRAPLADFSLQAFSFAQALYEELLADADPSLGALCGSLQFGDAYACGGLIANALEAVPELGRVVDAAEASTILGTRVEHGGLWLPKSGWLSPPAVCAALLEHPAIECVPNLDPLRVRRATDEQWSVLAGGKEVARSGTIIVAAGLGSNEFLDHRLPIRAVRGQCTNIPESALAGLNAVLCHKGYIAPATQGVHCIGATFAPGETAADLRTSDHRYNIERLAEALPASRHSLGGLNADSLEGRAEVRCVSPDYLPMAGRAADANAMALAFAPMKHNARKVVEHHGEFSGLYVSTAHGSRGLSYAALSAELLASEICGEPPPVSRELQRVLSPARFTIRGIIRSPD